MNYKKIFIIALIALMLISTCYAAKNVTDFKVDQSYYKVDSGKYFALYLTQNQESGLAIYKYIQDKDIADENDKYDHMVHDYGKQYIEHNDNIDITKNKDNTTSFKDAGHQEHGVLELVKIDGEQFVIVVFAKDHSKIEQSALVTILNNINKANDLTPIAY